MSRSWTPEQAELLDILENGCPRLARVAVAADAGAGKTSVLVERVRRLPSDRRILCVSFTEKSKADLEQRLADFVLVEVYTIHGFCSRVVSEFGAALGLPPFFRIMDADERDEVFYRAFEKVYRRSPPANVEHGVDRFWRLCQLASECGPGVRLHDGAGNDAELARFVAEVLAELDSAKRLLRVLEYSDLERYAVELLRRPEIRAQLKSRYQHVFVDEFQDTSSKQCELVTALSGSDGQIFVVGDQKQSIYRFRGADVEVFREFVNTLPARRRLSYNFRSHPEVIAAVNDVCREVIDGYEEMTAGRPDDHHELDPAIFATTPRVARVTAESDAEAIEALLRRLAAQGVDWSDVVLLLRRIKGNEELLAGLAERGIGVAITSSTSASANEELGRLLNLWIWACEPWQRVRAARVVTDFSAGDRARLDQAIEALESPLAARPRLSCEELLGELNARYHLQERFGAVYEQFEVFVLKHQSEGLSPARLARRLHQLLSNEQDISGFVLLPPPANLAGTVRVLTVHSSKGLEFPVVILADVGPRRKRSSGLLKRGEDLWLPARDEEGGLDWSPPEMQNARALEDEAETHESARLLYVAMTRAQEALYVVDRAQLEVESADKPKKAAKRPDTSWSAWLKAGLKTTLPSELFAGDAPALAKTGRETARPPEPAPLAIEPPRYVKARYGVTEWVGKSEESKEAPAPLKTTTSHTRVADVDPRQLGTDIHKHFELEDWEGLRETARSARLDLSRFETWLQTEAGRSVFGSGALARPEFAFEWRHEGATLTGRIDRLVIAGDQAWVVDYKVLLGRKSREELLAAYGPQLRAYALAVKTLTKASRVRAFLLDVGAATGEVWHEVET